MRGRNGYQSEADSRRAFLRRAGLAVGSASIIAAPGRLEAGQKESRASRVIATAGSKAAAGKEDELKKELLSLSEPTQAEPGCLTYDLYQAADDKTLFLRFEVWESEETMKKHLEQPYLKQSWARRQALGLVTGPVEITKWEKVG
ncbi:MAG TPA: putative quinol monooxygenase [Blastocatellia bacterium]|nr:putative quinol monooxygenase [Blastocatellia bacterium]